MAINKVVYNTKDGEQVLMDLTGDTVTPETLAVGATAHDASGKSIEGILNPQDGKSAYEIWLENGNTGTEQDFLDSLKGEDGYTPVKGTDYFTEADKAEIVQEVIENGKGTIVQAIIEELQGLPVFGVVDENKVITVTSQLSGGTYTLKYENADGTLVDVGTITIEGKVVIVNLLETALTPNDITTVFDGKGYKNGYYASAAEPFYNTDAAFFCSGLMPIPASRTFYIKGCTMDTSLSHTRFGLMTENGSTINTAVLANWGTTFTFTKLGEQYYSVYVDPNYAPDGLNPPYYFYFSASGTGDNVIVSATPIE